MVSKISAYRVQISSKRLKIRRNLDFTKVASSDLPNKENMSGKEEIESLEKLLSKLDVKDLESVNKILYGIGCR